MVEGKTVPGLRAALRADAALAKLLRVRLAAAVKRCREVNAEPESVHQLRVATRRATAALRLAKDSLPGKRRHRTVVTLRTLRRQAGEVRDIDIFLEALDAAALSDSVKAFLTGHAAFLRAIHFEALKEAVAELLPDLTKAAQAVPQAVMNAGDEAYAAIHARSTRRILRQFRTALDEATASLDTQHLHQMRIKAKRLRYTLELAAGPGPQLELLLTQLEKLQEILGTWHDVHAVNERLITARMAALAVNGAAGSPVMKGIATLTRNGERVEAKQIAALRRWLTGWKAFARRHPLKSLVTLPTDS